MELWIAVAILVVVLAALVREIAAPAAIITGGVVLFVLAGILTPERAFAGFANPATISVAGLFIVSRTVRDHAGLAVGLRRLLGDGSHGPRATLLRLLVPVVGASAVVNNTPIVATAGPIVRDWADRHGVAATKLLIPLSFAAILGGTLTIIGTGPNLVVAGLVESSGYGSFGFFTLTPAGLPVALVGGALLVLLAPRLLPDRREQHQRHGTDGRDYTVRLGVRADGTVVDRSVEEAGLRDLPTTYLASVLRRGREIAPVAPTTVLEADDELVFVGRVSEVSELLAHPGLVEAEHRQTRRLDGDGHGLVECVVGANSLLVGATLKDVAFRGRYGGAVVAIHRAGERLDAKLGTVELRPGDALLVLGDDGFVDRWQGRTDFAVVTALGDRPNGDTSRRHRIVTLTTVLAMIVASASGLVPVSTAVLGACAVLVATRAIGFRRALDSLDRDVLLIVAGAIGLGAGLEASGLAGAIASGVAAVADTGGPVLALAAVVLATLLLTEMITNVAAAALIVPIALDLAVRVGADPIGFAVAVALAASASFLTPIGYQTNTIVYGLGGYRFGDFWRLGLPLACTTTAVVLLVVPRVWG